MPVSITKNKKDKQTILNLVHQAFPDQEIEKTEELTEGFFNVAYGITLTDGSEVILKIAPTGDMDVMTHEINIMYSEVVSMKMIARIKGSRFGYYGQTDKQGDNWFTVFRSMLQDTYQDAERKSINIAVPMEQLLLLLDRDRHIFEQVKEPSFVHWDIWAGNVFIDEDKITGIIDFERCLWADELMEVGFRTCWCEKGFIEGYGFKELKPDQLIRAEWYDIYLFLICCLECDYRMYDNRGAYEFGTKMLLEWVEKKKSNR